MSDDVELEDVALEIDAALGGVDGGEHARKGFAPTVEEHRRRCRRRHAQSIDGTFHRARCRKRMAYRDASVSVCPCGEPSELRCAGCLQQLCQACVEYTGVRP